MPFDSALQLDVAPAEQDLSFATGREGLRRLAVLLRREMPDDFEWDFGTFFLQRGCGTKGCALGLAQRRWPGFRLFLSNDGYVDAAVKAFGIPRHIASAIFGGSVGFYGARHERDVTPDKVADAIDRYLLTSSSR